MTRARRCVPEILTHYALVKARPVELFRHYCPFLPGARYLLHALPDYLGFFMCGQLGQRELCVTELLLLCFVVPGDAGSQQRI